MARPLASLDRETKGLKLFPLFTLLGWGLVGFSIVVSVFVLGPSGADYFGTNAKATRDAAEVGSTLLGQLTLLSTWPKILAPLTFLGVASFMVGIALEFAAIPSILERRIAGLKKALPLMVHS
ncbi:MAG: hypothetical protein R3300_18710 [Candidatus Promineifilaceae bacterium]|nr:hypothetical protein [Candidatus Promineifilaceae bacterium]